MEPLVALFKRHGGGVVVEEAGGFNPDEGEGPPTDGADAIVRTYLPIDRTTRERRAHIDVGIRLFSLVQALPSLQERELAESDWAEVWKAHFPVIHVGRRLVVVAPWHEYSPADGEIVLVLDPGMAFGTGHHPSTRMCLEALEAVVKPGVRVLDVGTGSGILALAAARLGARSVLALDTEADAVRAARRNVRRNALRRRVRVVQGTLPYPGVPQSSADLVLANISAKVVRELACHLAGSLAPGGTLAASGFIAEQERPVREALAGAGFELVRRVQDGDWVTLALRYVAPR